MIKGFYELDEYPHELPNPSLFPIHETDISAIEGYPDTYSNGFMLDLSVGENDKEMLKKAVVKTVTKVEFASILEVATRGATILLSEPQYIYDEDTFIGYVMLAPDIEPVGMQVQYYRYFRNRYPGCNFYTDGTRLNMNLVKLGDKVVGTWMPLLLPRIEGV